MYVSNIAKQATSNLFYQHVKGTFMQKKKKKKKKKKKRKKKKSKKQKTNCQMIADLLYPESSLFQPSMILYLFTNENWQFS